MQFNLNRLKGERIARGFSQEEVAKFVTSYDGKPLTTSGYSRIEAGKRKLGMNQFVQICNALKIDDVSIFFTY